MELKPVRNYKIPAYPTKEEVLRNPRLLKTLPERWRGNAYAAVALSSLVFMTLTACGNGTKTGKNVPLFIHGEGRGFYGCVAVAPPAFLSEDEAFDVISEEAKREGITFEKNALVFENVKMPKPYMFDDPQVDEKKEEKMGTVKANLTLDGFDETKKIGFEFVSNDDIQDWSGRGKDVHTPNDVYRFLATAKVLSKSIKNRTGDKTVAVFYDPNYKFDSKEVKDIINKYKHNTGKKNDHERMEYELKEYVKSDLREQVRDFIVWLKGQGMI